MPKQKSVLSNAAKLVALREAARIGELSFDRVQYRSFENPRALRRCLRRVAARVINRAKKT